jgi:membrane protein insertase Oxa1/YidC/SpoIIIJ
LALADEWRTAKACGEYRRSTRGLSLEQVGFIHASGAHQVEATYGRFYADAPEVLLLTIEMRHQPFALWIKDLSAPDPLTPVNLFGLLPFTPPSIIALGVLPILLGITMYIQFKLNPAPVDPVQQQVFSIMPWIMMFLMAPFAAGLQLYWVVNNLLTIAQQKFLYSRHPGMKESPGA